MGYDMATFVMFGNWYYIYQVLEYESLPMGESEKVSKYIQFHTSSQVLHHWHYAADMQRVGCLPNG